MVMISFVRGEDVRCERKKTKKLSEMKFSFKKYIYIYMLNTEDTLQKVFKCLFLCVRADGGCQEEEKESVLQ